MDHRSPERRWFPDVWDLPGGHVEPGEDERTALRRELREEVGVEALAIEPLARYFISPGWCNEELVAYRATGLVDVGTQPATDEDLEIVTIAPNDVPGLIAAGEIADAKTITTLLAHLSGSGSSSEFRVPSSE